MPGFRRESGLGFQELQSTNHDHHVMMIRELEASNPYFLDLFLTFTSMGKTPISDPSLKNVVETLENDGAVGSLTLPLTTALRSDGH